VNPGWGDAVQANKAGLMEIGDVFVINKADRPGVTDTRRDLEQMLDLSEAKDWRPPIVATDAVNGDGIDDLVAAVHEHRAHLESSGELSVRRERRLRDELALIVTQRLRRRADSLLAAGQREELEAAVVARRLDPWTAADQVLTGLPGA
jgi:LAO/AO transport system kinase